MRIITIPPSEKTNPITPTHPHAHLVVEAFHEVQHGVGVAQPLRRHVEELDRRLPPPVAPAEVLVDLLNRCRWSGARHVRGRDASARRLHAEKTSSNAVGGRQ